MEKQHPKIAKLDRMGEKSALNLITAMAQSKNQSWSRVLYGLGIRYVGSVNAKILAESFRTVEELANASVTDLASVYGIGEEIAQSVYDWFIQSIFISNPLLTSSLITVHHSIIPITVDGGALGRIVSWNPHSAP